MGGGAPLIGYGLTETNAVGCGNWRDNYLAKPDSTARASAPFVALAILDGAGRPVPQGVRGESAIRSVCTFKRSRNDTDPTRSAVTDTGSFMTGALRLPSSADRLLGKECVRTCKL